MRAKELDSYFELRFFHWVEEAKCRLLGKHGEILIYMYLQLQKPYFLQLTYNFYIGLCSKNLQKWWLLVVNDTRVI